MKLALAPLVLCLLWSASAGAANLIADPGFENYPPGTNLDTNNQYDNQLLFRWGVDSSIVTTTENGIVPDEGTQMARANIGTWTDMLTLIDLSTYAADVNAGNATVDLAAHFNSVDPADFFITLGTLDGPLPQALTQRLHVATSPTLTTDGLAATWESQSLTNYLIQPGSDYLVVGVHNIFDNTNPSYFDNVSVAIVVPEPSHGLLMLCGSCALALKRRRKLAR